MNRSLVLASSLLLGFTGLAQADFNVTWPPPQAPDGTPVATFAQPRYDWFGRFLGNLDKLKSGPYDFVMDGDSITDNWQNGQDILHTRYGAIKVLDNAISGDQTQHVLWRVQHGDLEGQDPRLIMLMIGTNNGGQKPEEIAAGIKLIIGEYEKRCPHAHILLLAILPRSEQPTAPERVWIANTNKIIATFVEDKRVTYLDIGAKFLNPDGTIPKDLMPDFLHPSVQGYVVWADAIQSVINQYFPEVAKANAAAPAK